MTIAAADQDFSLIVPRNGAVLALAIGIIVAAASPGHAVAPFVIPVEAPGVDKPDEAVSVAREIARFKTVSLSIQDALLAALALHPGARVIDASFDGRETLAVYRVRTLRGNLIFEDAMDASSGRPIGTTLESSARQLAAEDMRILTAFGDVRQEMKEAIAVAERNTKGRTISGGLKRLDGRLNFVIVTVADDSLKQVVLEPPSAKDLRKTRK